MKSKRSSGKGVEYLNPLASSTIILSQSDVYRLSNADCGLLVPKSTSTAGHTVYDPSKSTTFKDLSGSSWKISYGDSSSASGNVGTDNIVIGGLTIKNQAIELAETLSTQFEQGVGDGLLGLAWGSIK